MTVTTKSQVSELPEGSVKVYWTVVGPGGSIVGGVWVDDVRTSPESSVAVGSVQSTNAAVSPGFVVVEKLDGHPLTTGGVMST